MLFLVAYLAIGLGVWAVIRFDPYGDGLGRYTDWDRWWARGLLTIGVILDWPFVLWRIWNRRGPLG